MSSPSNVQFRMTITALVLSTLSLLRLPEISDYLIRRWKRCRPLEAALEWVPMILDQLIPDLRSSLGNFIRPETDSLEKATKRFLEIRDRRNKTFIPWTYDGRKELVNEVEADILNINRAYSICEMAGRDELIEVDPPESMV